MEQKLAGVGRWFSFFAFFVALSLPSVGFYRLIRRSDYLWRRETRFRWPVDLFGSTLSCQRTKFVCPFRTPTIRIYSRLNSEDQLFPFPQPTSSHWFPPPSTTASRFRVPLLVFSLTLALSPSVPSSRSSKPKIYIPLGCSVCVYALASITLHQRLHQKFYFTRSSGYALSTLRRD